MPVKSKGLSVSDCSQPIYRWDELKINGYDWLGAQSSSVIGSQWEFLTFKHADKFHVVNLLYYLLMA